MNETVDVMEFTDEDFKTLIKKLKSVSQEYLNKPYCSDKVRKSILEMIPTYNRIIEGTETLPEVVDLTYYLNQLEILEKMNYLHQLTSDSPSRPVHLFGQI